MFTHFTFATGNTAANMTLADAERQACSTNLALKQSEQDVVIAKKELENTGKTLEVSGNANVNNSHTSLGDANTNTLGGTLVLNPQWSLYGSTTSGSALLDQINQLGITYSPFEFKQLIDTKQKEYELFSKIAAFEKAKIQLIIDVRSAYAQVIQKKKLLLFALENAGLAGEHLKRTQARFEAGKIPRIDLTEAEQKSRTAQLEITNAQLALDSALLQLNQLTGSPISIEGMAGDETSMTWAKAGDINLDATIAACVSDTPEIQMVNKSVENNQLLDKVADMQWATGWSLSLGQEWKTTGQKGDEYQTFSVTVKGSPIYSQSWKGKKEIALLNLENSKTAKNDLLVRTASDLKNAWNGWQIAENGLVPKEEAVTLAKERLRLTTLKFENGMASAADVNKDRESLAQSEEDYWSAWLDMQKAREKFYQAAWGKPVLK